ncbi:hypothetical protein [Flavobacterium sp. HNIBRBA15423]|uniref:hypothetical protein n=1 Tax=Flavobacterium sp. HNIBRBA15423 TaxID=3458683 RepID=UPI0040439B31
MKKYLILLFFVFQMSFAQEKTTITIDKVSVIKKIYNWNEEQFLIINFNQPRKNCHYNNYLNVKESKDWLLKNVYNIESINKNRIIHVYSDRNLAKKVIDNLEFYEDFDNFFTNNFSSKGDCYALIIINQRGEIASKLGEYYREDLINLIEKIK